MGGLTTLLNAGPWIPTLFSMGSAVRQHRIWPRFSFWNACFLAVFAAGCTSGNYPGPVVRDTVPALADPDQAGTAGAPKGVIVVKRGDSLYKLARRNGVALRGLIEANKLSPPYVIYPGQHLRLPVSRYHVVAKGQTVYQIARHYDVDMGALVRVNNIEPPYRVFRGQRLRLPGNRVVRVATADPSSSPKWGVGRVPAPTRERTPAPPARSRWHKPDPAPIKAPPARAGPKFMWPLRGKIIQSFGPRAGGLHNDGINIAARKGASIRAAENGVVAYTGNQLQGFGNLVLVKHAGGWMSAYAHSSIILVRRGDIVRRGQVIARVGRTGNVSRPQLHFELRRGDQAVNPKNYLVRLAMRKRLLHEPVRPSPAPLIASVF